MNWLKGFEIKLLGEAVVDAPLLGVQGLGTDVIQIDLSNASALVDQSFAHWTSPVFFALIA